MKPVCVVKLRLAIAVDIRCAVLSLVNHSPSEQLGEVWAAAAAAAAADDDDDDDDCGDGGGAWKSCFVLQFVFQSMCCQWIWLMCRKLLQFGVLEDLVRRVRKYPVQLVAAEASFSRVAQQQLSQRQLNKYLDGSQCFDEISCHTGELSSYMFIYQHLLFRILLVVKFTHRVGQKMDCFWELITLRWLMGERHVICQKFRNFV